MANIRIINSIRLNKTGLQINDEDGEWINLHCQQGRLDGACAVYSTIMALLCLGVLSEADIQIMTKPDRRTKKGKFLYHLFEQQGLIRDGYYLNKMAEEVQNFLPNYIIKYHKGENVTEKVVDCINNGLPVIISVDNDNRDLHHALLVIGTESDGELGKEKLLKLFCLDPGYEISNISYWNCIIDTSLSKLKEYPYRYTTDSFSCKVNITEIITFEY